MFSSSLNSYPLCASETLADHCSARRIANSRHRQLRFPRITDMVDTHLCVMHNESLAIDVLFPDDLCLV